jgi:peptidoglycan/LPS O-acetylase OafA/YrhL
MSSTVTPSGRTAVRPRPHLGAIDGLRFVAALHIVMFHTMHIAGLRIINWGSTSTSMFFVLSGFLLTYAYGGAAGRLRVPARHFLLRRVARLYPLAILSQLVVIPFVWTVYPAAERLPRAAAVLTGVQGWMPRYADSFNSPGWSVTVFVFCYAALPLLLRVIGGLDTRRLALVLLGVWVWCLLPTALWMLTDGGAYWNSAIHHHPFSRFPEFAFGAVLATLLASTPGVQAPRWTTGAALALIALALMFLPASTFPLAHNGLIAPLHALLIVGLANGSGVVARTLATPLFRELGKASYGMFLLHVPLYAWTIMRLADVLAPLPLPARASAYVGYLVLTALVAWLVQRWIADPIAHALVRAGSPRPPLVARPESAG